MPYVKQQQHRQDYSQGRQYVFADMPTERHTESHPIVFDKEYLKPVTQHRYGLSDMHVGLDQNLHHLVNGQQQHCGYDYQRGLSTP